MKKLTNLFFLILFISAIGCDSQKTIETYDLRCENLREPLGIDTTIPRFSWKIKISENENKQVAYQILVAGNQDELSENDALLWNSGKVESDNTILVSYNGQKLNSGNFVWWKVRVWDKAGNVSEWSTPACFSIGLLKENDWKASYIALNTPNGYDESPQLYKSFITEDIDSEYFLHVNSLVYHEVYLNGQKIGDGVLAPAVSQFNKRSLINTYLVSPFLKEGENDLIIWLGSGWYTEGLSGVSNNGPVVRVQLEKVTADSSTTILSSDETWQGRKSSYTRHGSWKPDQFGGEIVDGRLARVDTEVKNPDNLWQPVAPVNIPVHIVSPQMTQQNIITDTIRPVSVQEIAPDTFLVDMGINLTGWLNINFPDLEHAQQIKIDYCDHLVNGNRFNDRNQYDVYIASGNQPEMFINKFNYHGFRYIRITGMKEQPSTDSINAYLIHTGFESASGFESSDEDLNAIHDMLFYTLKCLSMGGVFVDCPQIERLGYGGDGNASTVTAQTMFELAPLYSHWLQVWDDVIRDDGSMPHTAPNPYPAGGGPYWCGFIITASWNTYLNYGDSLILKKHYPVMQKWLSYVDEYSVDGLLKRWPDTDYRNWYLGDWATPEGINQTDEASVDLVNNSFLAVCFDNMERIATVLGKPDDADFYRNKKKTLQEKIHHTFYNENSNTYASGTQIDLAFPMLADVVPAEKLPAVERSLYDETIVNRNGHFATGLVGLPVLTAWAVKNNATDLMYMMLKKRDYPGYLYMIDNGATTTWEHWGGHRSRIHNCYNSIGSWFYQAVGGIQSIEDVPAFRRIKIQPQIPQGLTWANVRQDTPFGQIVVNWKLENDQYNLELEIPAGVEAEVILPENYKDYVLSDSIPKNNNGNINLKSGRYNLSYKHLRL